jgi:hypothetical protein
VYPYLIRKQPNPCQAPEPHVSPHSISTSSIKTITYPEKINPTTVALQFLYPAKIEIAEEKCPKPRFGHFHFYKPSGIYILQELLSKNKGLALCVYAGPDLNSLFSIFCKKTGGYIGGQAF